MFLGALFLSRPLPTNESCSAGFWLSALGFFASFAPMFAKAWRIYAIFFRSSMTVVKISDKRLALKVALAFVMDMVIVLCESA
jgi:hypothetical protein